MSFIWIGYGLFAIVVLLITNIILRNTARKKATKQIDDKMSVQQQEEQKPVSDTSHKVASKLPTRYSKNEHNGRKKKEQRYVDPRKMKKGPLMAVMLLGAFAAILNQTLLNVAIPEIMNDFDVTASTAQWLTTAYMLVNGVLIPITAFLMRTFSTRKIFITAMSLFTIGTLICSFSPAFFVLLLGRVVQASGAGMLMPLLMNVFLTIFPPEKRGAAMGTVGIVIMFAPAIGPTLSGWIIEHYAWRDLFYVVLPFAVIDIILAVLFLKNVLKLTFPKIDVWGIVLSTIGFGGILYGFSEAGNDGWSSMNVVLTLVVGGVAMLLFIWRELVIDEPMLDLRVFKYDMFALSSVIRLIAVMAMFSAMLLIPIYMQTIRGFSALESGLILLPGAIMMGIFQPITGILFDKIGGRPLALVGLALTVWTTWELHDLSATTSYSFIMTIYALRMVGLAGVMMPIMTTGLNQLPQRLHAHGTAMANTLQQVAGSIGTAVMVSIYTAQTKTNMTTISNATTSDSAYQQFSDLVRQIAGSMGLPVDQAQVTAQQMLYGQAYKEALIEGMNDAFYVATILAAIAFVLAIFLRRTYPPDEKEETLSEQSPSYDGEPSTANEG